MSDTFKPVQASENAVLNTVDNGRMAVTTDTYSLYVDISGIHVKITDVLTGTYSNISGQVTPLVNKIYLATDQDKLVYYTSSNNTVIEHEIGGGSGGGSSTLSGLTDVTISSPSSGQALVYNGSGWVNGSTTGSGGTKVVTEDGKTSLQAVTNLSPSYPGATRGIGAVDLQQYRANNGTIAGGDYSVAMGRSNGTSGHCSVAMGYYNYAYSECSISIGYSNEANKDYAIAMGYNNLAAGNYAVVMGYYNYAIGDYSIAMGCSNAANNNYSVSIGGSHNNSRGYQSYIFGGNYNEATGRDSFIIAGYYDYVAGAGSAIVSGYANTNNGEYSAIISGVENTIESNSYNSIIAGGNNNTLKATGSFITGTYNNTKSNYSACFGTSCNNLFPSVVTNNIDYNQYKAEQMEGIIGHSGFYSKTILDNLDKWTELLDFTKCIFTGILKIHYVLYTAEIPVMFTQTVFIANNDVRRVVDNDFSEPDHTSIRDYFNQITIREPVVSGRKLVIPSFVNNIAATTVTAVQIGIFYTCLSEEINGGGYGYGYY